MKSRQVWARSLAAVAFVMVASLQAQQPPAQAAGGGAQDQVAALKQSMQQGLAKIRQYEWVETTIISLKGEEKARKQNRCYYGADGKVQKVSLDQAPAPEQAPSGRGGRRGAKVKEKVVENKKDEMKEYMQQAAALIHSYVPPDPRRSRPPRTPGGLRPTRRLRARCAS